MPSTTRPSKRRTRRQSRRKSRRKSRRLVPFSVPLSSARADDWTPVPPGGTERYRIHVDEEGRIRGGGKGRKERSPSTPEERRFSYVILPSRRIYAFHLRDRNHLMCSADAIRERRGRLDLVGSSCETSPFSECCLYHGKLVQLLLDHGVASPDGGLLSAGEFVVDSTSRLVSVSNQSGHFFPPNLSNDNFVSVLASRLRVPIRLRVRDWEGGDPSPWRKVTVLPSR